MQKEVTDSTIDLVREYLPQTGVSFPLKSEEDVQILADYFEEMEVSLSNALSDGEPVDRSLLSRVAKAFDELAVIEDEDFHDLDTLNERLFQRNSSE